MEMKFKTRGNSDHHDKAKVFFSCYPEDHDRYFETVSDMILKHQNCVIWYMDQKGTEYEYNVRQDVPENATEVKIEFSLDECLSFGSSQAVLRTEAIDISDHIEIDKKKKTISVNISDIDVIKSIKGKEVTLTFYAQTTDNEVDRDDFELQLNSIQLIAIPVTSKLLVKDSFTMEVVYPIAKDKHIPILPIMMEEGLDEIYRDRFGAVEYIKYYSGEKDHTELTFDEKLERYLSAVLIGDDLAAHVRAAFAAYIFMSYRKKDRKYAHELMKMIHKDERHRDIAIWYDEYLVPGEDFNESIRKALEKSEVFALVVTPSLLENPNYVMCHEYPAARESGKTIVPVEMKETDVEMLRGFYEGMPDYVKKGDLRSQEEYIVEQLKKVAAAPVDDDPGHDFLIGLAYLEGIDVESDNDKALRLITSAAKRGVLEATKKLVDMYKSGQGVEIDHFRSVEWQEKLVEQRKEICEKEKNVDNVISLFNEIWRLGNAYQDLGRLDEAEQIYEEMLEISSEDNLPKRSKSISLNNIGDIREAKGDLEGAESVYEESLRIFRELAEETKTIGSRRDLSASLRDIGNIREAKGDLEGAQCHYEESLRIARELAEETKTVESLRDLSVSLGRIGGIRKAKGDLEGAQCHYEESLRIARELAEETQTIDSRRNLSISLDRIGNIRKEKGDLEGAESSFEEALRIARELAEETKTIESRSDLSVSLDRIGDLKAIKDDLGGAVRYYEESLKIARELAEEMQTITSRRDLSVSLSKIADIRVLKDDLEEAESYYEESLKIAREIAEETKMIEIRLWLSQSLGRIGDIRVQKDDYEGAESSYEESLRIDMELAEETQTLESRRNLSVSLERMGLFREAKGDLEGAERYYEESLKITGELAEETQTIDTRMVLSQNLERIGDIRAQKGDLEGAESYYEGSLKIAREIAEETQMIEIRLWQTQSLEKIGHIRVQKDDFEGAQSYYEESLRIRKELAEETQTLENYGYLSESLVNLGIVEIAKGNKKEAGCLFKRSLEIAENINDQERITFVKGLLEKLRD